MVKTCIMVVNFHKLFNRKSESYRKRRGSEMQNEGNMSKAQIKIKLRMLETEKQVLAS